MQLVLGPRKLSLERPRVMGVLNVTPDSFSDGGRFLDRDAALTRAQEMRREGADIIDVGGESTRPGADAVSASEEIDRIAPLIESITQHIDVAVSVDTSKPDVMCAAVAAGAAMINDVCALREEGALAAAAECDAAICLMHMQGTPQNMQKNPRYASLPGDIITFLEARVRACVAAGIEKSRLVIDPGFGFGKSDEHNLQILAGLAEFRVLGLPILVGLSRKRTLGILTGRPVTERGAAGVAAAVIAFARGARIVRTHDVAATVDALRIASAVHDEDQVIG